MKVVLSKEVLPNGAEVWRTERGEARLTRPAPTVVLITLKGYATIDLFPLVVTEPERLMRSGVRFDWFGDYGEMTGYDSQMRISLSDFTATNKSNIDTIAILVRSKIVAMGVSVANLAVGGKIDVYANRESFEHALSEATLRSRTKAQPAAR